MSEKGDEIARIALAIWEAEGEPEGRDHELWMRAKRIVEEGYGNVEFPVADGTPDAVVPKPECVWGTMPPTASQPVGDLGCRVDKALVDGPQCGDEASPVVMETPGTRNPDPPPRTNDGGYVTVPSLEDAAAGATGGDRMVPRPNPDGSNPGRPLGDWAARHAGFFV